MIQHIRFDTSHWVCCEQSVRYITFSIDKIKLHIESIHKQNETNILT